MQPRAASLNIACERILTFCVCCEQIVIQHAILNIGYSGTAKVNIVGAWRIYILCVEHPLPTFVECVLKKECQFVGMTVHCLLEVPYAALTVHHVIVSQVASIRHVRVAAELKALELAHRAITIIYKWSLVVEIARILAVTVFVE